MSRVSAGVNPEWFQRSHLVANVEGMTEVAAPGRQMMSTRFSD
jgi:hypothetical protein